MSRWWLACLLLQGMLGCRTPELPERKRAVLIVLDAARSDRFGFQGYERNTTPNMDVLARQGLVSERHYAHFPNTRWSIPSLFHSRYFTTKLFPSHRKVPLYEPEALLREQDAQTVSLPKVFQAAGYRTAAISSHSWMYPGEPFSSEFQEFQQVLEPWFLTQEWAFRIWQRVNRWILQGDGVRLGTAEASAVVDQSIEWIGSHSDEDFFLYIHVMDTHMPHRFGADAVEFLGEKPGRAERDQAIHRRSLGETEALSSREKALIDALYDGSLRSTDRELGRLFEAMDEWGILDDTLIVITSDHGEALGEVPGRYEHGGEVFESRLHIPLVIHKPSSVSAGVLPGFSGLVDVGPTMLGIMQEDLPAEKSLDGVDLTQIATGVRPSQSVALGPGFIRDERFKLMLEQPYRGLASGDSMPGTVEGQLFDLEADPLETEDVGSAHPEEGLRLAAAHQGVLQPRWERHESTRRDAPPPTPFAVQAQRADAGEGVRITGTYSRGEALEKLVLETGWVVASRSKAQPKWILGGGGTEPWQFEFGLPNGTYRVTAQTGGRGWIQLGEQARVDVDGSGELHPMAEGDEMDLGKLEVQDGVFRATLAPTGDAEWFWFRWFGFEPMGAPKASNPQHEERLRALGYIE
ncbi:MAG: sulfatase [Myxococcota bacterium]|nr:sulfatase [Myxococcota bacterium]